MPTKYRRMNFKERKQGQGIPPWMVLSLTLAALAVMWVGTL
jgi:type VI protein secretion system component VasF